MEKRKGKERKRKERKGKDREGKERKGQGRKGKEKGLKLDPSGIQYLIFKFIINATEDREVFGSHPIVWQRNRNIDMSISLS